jgi:flagellar basal-body rod modification protein FlgD
MADSTVGSVSDFINAMNASAGTSRKDDQNLSMEDFFQLMVAQLKNQDMFNPADNSQLVDQMAQFSMVTALTDIQELSNVTYSMSLIGKEATVAFITDNGVMESVTGLIEGVNLYGGSAEVVIDGDSYGLSNVMTVRDVDGQRGESSLTSNAGLIGMYATAMRATDEGAETVSGIIEMLRLVSGEVKAYIGGKSFSLGELSEISAAPAQAEESESESE